MPTREDGPVWSQAAQRRQKLGRRIGRALAHARLQKRAAYTRPTETSRGLTIPGAFREVRARWLFYQRPGRQLPVEGSVCRRIVRTVACAGPGHVPDRPMCCGLARHDVAPHSGVVLLVIYAAEIGDSSPVAYSLTFSRPELERRQRSVSGVHGDDRAIADGDRLEDQASHSETAHRALGYFNHHE